MVLKMCDHDSVTWLKLWSRETLRDKIDRLSRTSREHDFTATASIDETNNVIPSEARAVFNIRFNDLHTSATLINWIQERMGTTGYAYNLDIEVSGESFLTPPGSFIELIDASVAAVTGVVPEHSTAGGTSDARFLKDYCPVAEFGLVGKTMHKVDECTAVSDLETLTRIYLHILRGTFTGS